VLWTSMQKIIHAFAHSLSDGPHGLGLFKSTVLCGSKTDS